MMRRSVALSPRVVLVTIGKNEMIAQIMILRLDAEAEPDGEQRNDGDDRDRVRDDDVGKHAALEEARMHDAGRQRDTEHGRDQEAGERFEHGETGVVPEVRGLEETVDDVGRGRQQPGRDIEGPDR